MRLRPLLLGSMIFMVILSTTFLAKLHRSHKYNKVSDIQKAAATVSIVRNDERSGGTGVIIESNSDHSYILTNNHVCDVTANGGLVISDNNEKYQVVSYRQSMVHDLCLLRVNANLGVDTAVADSPPALYDPATVSGHPALYPTIITKGHFSHHREVDVAIGLRPCTENDLKDPGSALYCVFFGGIPVMRHYEVQVVSATIMPGSSGSAVYNNDGEIAGLVFAGSGELGYGMIVPQEYVHAFIFEEAQLLAPKFPSTTRGLASTGPESGTNKPTKNKCENIKDVTLKRFCYILGIQS